MREVEKQLFIYPRKTITLSQLEAIIKPNIQSYDEFSMIILTLEDQNILQMIKAKGRTARVPSLALQYRINKSLLGGSHHDEIQHFRNILHPSIKIDFYYSKEPSRWQQDLPYIKKVDDYIKKYSFPTEHVPAPERSYELVGDEKWIAEKGGKELLERLAIFEQLKIIPVSEPLMFAINPDTINNETQLHLIVENKTTYQGLLPSLSKTIFSTLIYGCGKSVIKSIEQFPIQYPVQARHLFYYFGDIDHAGIEIWHSLNKRQKAVPALPFYRACLEKKSVKGKSNQKENLEAKESFVGFFLPHEQSRISNLLAAGGYHPQETLKTKELQEVWRESQWKAWK